MNENIIAHTVDDKRTKDVLIEQNVSFQTMFLSPKCLEGLAKCGFQKPSPIQLKSIPLGRCGFDLIMKSKSGTGKTLVFSVLALEMIDISVPDLQVLVLAPTREIAVQNADTIKAVGSSFTGLVVNSFIGGLPEKDDIDKARNCHIAVGAPGRIKSLIKQNILNVNSVKLFVLDEADKLMETSFLNDVNEIYSSLPLKKQIIAASATYPENLENFLSNYMQSPTHVSSENDTQLLLGLKHFVREVKPSSNVAQVMWYKNEELLKLLANISFTQCIIFSNFQTRAENVSISINRHGWNSQFISAAQSQQKRLEVIDNLRKFKCRVLLSTDLTARGIDVSNVDLVINYDVPVDVSTYLHRMGRAGRYGSKGVCISLVSGEKDLLQIRKFLGIIGGTNLKISKLGNVENGIGDLWAYDESKFEKISGIAVENEDITQSIKTEVLSLKNCSQVLDDRLETTKNTKKNEKKNKDSEPLKNKKKESEKKIVHNDCLQSLAEGTFEFINIPSPSNSPSVEEVASFNRDNSEAMDQHENIDPKSILKSLAEGTFDFGNIPSPANENAGKFSGENEAMDQNENVDAKSILKSLAEGTFDFENVPSPASEYAGKCSSESDKDTLSCTNDAKTRKSSEFRTAIDEKMCKNEIYIKNKGIYEVAKILNNHPVTNSDMETNVGNYLKILDQPTTNLLEETKENTVPKDFKQEQNNQNDTKNIFSCAYLHIIEKIDDTWKLHVKESELSRMNVENKEEEDEPMEEEYEEEPEEDYDDVMEEDYGEPEDYPQVEYDENGYENIPNRMVWVPVEYGCSGTNVEVPQENLLKDEQNFSGRDQGQSREIPVSEKSWANDPSTQKTRDVQEKSLEKWLRDCFHECSKELWAEGLTFRSPKAFGAWYDNNWLDKVSQVRNYAFRNLFIQEMSSYQNEMSKY